MFGASMAFVNDYISFLWPAVNLIGSPFLPFGPAETLIGSPSSDPEIDVLSEHLPQLDLVWIDGARAVVCWTRII